MRLRGILTVKTIENEVMFKPNFKRTKFTLNEKIKPKTHKCTNE